MIRLLIVDDEFRTRKGLSSLIERNSLPIEIIGTASNGMDGLALARSLRPDIILTDVRMPRMDGIKLSAEIRKLHPDCQIIFISGYADKEYLKSAIFLKAVSYVEKPIEDHEILDALTSAIHNIEENQKKSDMIKQNQLLQRQQQDMLRKNAALAFTLPATAHSRIDRLANLYPGFWHHPYYCTLICQINYKEGQKGRAQYVSSKLENILTEYCSTFLFAQKKTCIFIIHLCGLEQDHTDSAHALICQLYEEIQEAISTFANLFLAVGNPVPQPEQLYDSYVNAVVCLKKLFFVGYDHICFFNNTDSSMGIPFRSGKTLYPDFAQALKDGDRQKATDIITRLFREIRRSTCKFETNSIKNVYCQLLIELDSICRERGLSNVLPYDGDFIWENISQSDTIFTLQSYLTDKLALYFDTFADRDGASLLVYRIRQYVETHFREPDLSINQMALNLHFTPAYLCQIFKNGTGITINTYINMFRISKARDLLLTKDAKLYEISSCVGYNDPNYFSRQFKKQVGMTPSEYRERHAI